MPAQALNAGAAGVSGGRRADARRLAPQRLFGALHGHRIDWDAAVAA
jgi:hypothetical protein